jgi:hypothetical protein
VSSRSKSSPSTSARDAALDVATAIGRAIERPFLPAAAAEGQCGLCDFRAVCGPYEKTVPGAAVHRRCRDVLDLAHMALVGGHRPHRNRDRLFTIDLINT